MKTVSDLKSRGSQASVQVVRCVARQRSISTAITMTAPMMILFVGSVAPIWASPFCSTAMINTPANAPSTEPRPPIRLVPLNVSRKSALNRDWYEKMVSVENPLTQLLEETPGRRFESEPDRSSYMYDQIAVASLIDPTLVTTEGLFVDVDIDSGISYGVSVGGREIWPGAEGA